MFDWLVSNPIAYIGAILVILVGGTMLKRAVNRGVNRAVHHTQQRALSYGTLEATDGGTRARMLWCSDSGGLPTIDGDWKALRKRLTKAAEAAGIVVTEHQRPRMNRVQIGDLPGHLRPEQSALADHRWQTVES